MSASGDLAAGSEDAASSSYAEELRRRLPSPGGQAVAQRDGHRHRRLRWPHRRPRRRDEGAARRRVLLREPAVGLRRDRRSGNGVRCLSRVSREAAVARSSAVLRAAGRSVVARVSLATVRRRWRTDGFSALQGRATSSWPWPHRAEGLRRRAGEFASPTPCGHNFCLKCFQKWVHSGKRACAKCRGPIPSKMVENPRINLAIVAAIRSARTAKNADSAVSASTYHYVRNEDRPDKAYTTERAKKSGKANASSGQIFVTIAPDHFGPIPAKHDPKRNIGVKVGDIWEDRFECRQWGAHFPYVSGIAGQSNHGAQSVALSGGYIDDEDHGEWFLYTGSGGRDLSGNKRTNKEQSSDQKFTKMNAALRLSCLKGYPVRVVRSHKEKRSSYAPVKGVRYDGCYRIEKCWRKIGVQGKYKVCRYLFVRCDNEAAPWTSDLHGDLPRPLPKIDELKGATDITERKAAPSWDYDEENKVWTWVKPEPISKKPILTGDPELDKEIRRTQKRSHLSEAEKLLKEFGCSICKKVITEPLTTPCGHNFCKTCLLGAFADKASMRERSRGGRTLRAQKIVKRCPSCPTDICDFLENPQINIEIMELIERTQKKAAKEKEEVEVPGEDAEEEEDDDAEEEEDDDAEEEEDDDSSLNEEENDGAEDKNGEEDADAPVVTIVVEGKEDLKKAQKLKGDEEEGKDEKKTKIAAEKTKTAAAAIDNAAEDDTEMEEVTKKRKGRGGAEAATAGGGKRKKTVSAGKAGGGN